MDRFDALFVDTETKEYAKRRLAIAFFTIDSIHDSNKENKIVHGAQARKLFKIMLDVDRTKKNLDVRLKMIAKKLLCYGSALLSAYYAKQARIERCDGTFSLEYDKILKEFNSLGVKVRQEGAPEKPLMHRVN